MAVSLNTETLSNYVSGFTSLPMVRQLGLMFGLAASVALGFGIVLWSQNEDYSVLFGELAQAETSTIMEVLQQQGVDFHLDERTGALMVPTEVLHNLRLELAKQGLPRSSPRGLDLLQEKQEFGTTQFMEQARYQHALEQELARSVETLAAVESARVHLALPKQSVFVRKRQQPSASVLVNLYAGRILEASQIAAITHMVASSIPNLEPGRVTLLDQRGRLLSDKKASAEMDATQDQFEYTRQIEESYVQRVENLLMPLLGMDGVRAQVAAEIDFTVTEKTEESFNPDLPALRSEQVSKERSTNNAIQGVPGALSNQPPNAGDAPEIADGAKGGGETVSERSRSTTNYELDRTISHTKLASGLVRRLSVAVVVDDRAVTGADGIVTHQPRSEEEIARITALVREAIGYNAARGDSVNVINASFDGVRDIAGIPSTPIWQQPWFINLAKMVLGALVVLTLILGVLRPVMRSLAVVKEEEEDTMIAAGADSLEDDSLSLSGGSELDGMVKLPGPDAYEANIKLLQDVVRDDPKLVAQVIRTWLQDV